MGVKEREREREKRKRKRTRGGEEDEDNDHGNDDNNKTHIINNMNAEGIITGILETHTLYYH